MFEQFTEYLTGWQLANFLCLLTAQNSSASAPLTPCQGMCPGPRWGLRPQIPVTTPSHCKPPGLASVHSNDGRIFSRFDERDSQPANHPARHSKRHRTTATLMHRAAKKMASVKPTIRVELAMQDTNNKKKKNNNVKTALKK